MKTNKTVLYSLIAISSGYLLHNYLFSNTRVGMMRHHYGYYDGYSANDFYTNSLLVFAAYFIIGLSLLFLIVQHQKSVNNSMSILDRRLTIGDITIEEYNAIKATINNERR